MPINATWCLSNNVGDVMTPWLIEKITGEVPLWSTYTSAIPKLMVCGSILNHASPYTTVWGAGLADSNDELGLEGVSVNAVRGPLTAWRVAREGKSVSHVGDPAMMAPMFHEAAFSPREKAPHRLGVVAHYVNQVEFYKWAREMDVPFINVFDSPEQFIGRLTQCQTIISSSLHGLILADAYQIPCVWVAGTNKLGGDGFKFHDRQALRNLLVSDNLPQALALFLKTQVDPLKSYHHLTAPHILQLPRDVSQLAADIEKVCPPADFAPVVSGLIESCPLELTPPADSAEKPEQPTTKPEKEGKQ
jgi:hypothetical protein